MYKKIYPNTAFGLSWYWKNEEVLKFTFSSHDTDNSPLPQDQEYLYMSKGLSYRQSFDFFRRVSSRRRYKSSNNNEV